MEAPETLRWLYRFNLQEHSQLGSRVDLPVKQNVLKKLNSMSRLTRNLQKSGVCYQEPGRLLLAGDLGIRHLFDQALASQIRGKITPSGLTHELQFIVKSNSSLTPTFAMIPVGGNVVRGSLGVEASRDDTHTLNIVFKKPKGEKKTILDVRILEDSTTDADRKPGDGPNILKGDRRKGLERKRTEVRRTTTTSEDLDTALDRARLLDRLDSLNIE